MKVIVFICMLEFLISSIYCNDNIYVEIKLVNIMTGSIAKYEYKNGLIKTYKSKDDIHYHLISEKKINDEKRKLFNESTNQLINKYGFHNTDFADYKILDGFIWSIKISFNENTVIFNVINCNNKYVDKMISVMNEELKRKQIIFETGYIYKVNCCE